MSHSAARPHRKIPGLIPMVHTIHGGLRALPENFGIFRGVGIGWGRQSLPRISSFWGQGCGSGHTCRIPRAKENAGMWAGMPSGVTAPLDSATLCSASRRSLQRIPQSTPEVLDIREYRLFHTSLRRPERSGTMAYICRAQCHNACTHKVQAQSCTCSCLHL